MTTRQESLDERRLSSSTSPHAAAVRIAVRVYVQAGGHSSVGPSNIDSVQYLLDWRQLWPSQWNEVGKVPCQNPEGLGRKDYAGSTKKFRDCLVHLITFQSLRLDSQCLLQGGDQRLDVGL